MIKPKARHRKSSHHELPFSNDTISHIALGAAAGCAIGAIAALLLTPKHKGHKFTRGLDDLYDHVTDAAGDYAHTALDKSQKLYNSAKGSAEDIYSAASNAFSKAGKSSNRNLILGIVGAGLLGASAVYALSQQFGDDHETLAEKWKTSKWSDMAKFVVDTVSHKLHDEEEEDHDEHHNPVQNVLDWAAVGMNIWQQIKKRR